MKNFYDTCSLLNMQEMIFEDDFYLSYTSLVELEDIKTSAKKDYSVKYDARKLMHLLDKNKDKYVVCGVPTMMDANEINRYSSGLSNDQKIIMDAKALTIDEDIIFVTDDLSCTQLAQAYGLKCKKSSDFLSTKEEYRGFADLDVSDELLAVIHENPDNNALGLITNQYLIAKNNDTKSLFKWDGSKMKDVRYSKISSKFFGDIKPRNIHQALAMDMLQDPMSKIKVITGCYGSGKDFLMIATALHLIQKNRFDKIVWVRNNVEVKNSKPIGFLPDGMKDKLLPFAMPFADHVGGEHGIESLIQSRILEIQHLGFIRGRDIKNSIIICSEAENMTKEHVQLLIGRIGDGSELWLNGDYNQADEDVFESNSGLFGAIDKLKGHELFGFVKLMKTERSKAAEMADLLN